MWAYPRVQLRKRKAAPIEIPAKRPINIE